MGNIDHDAVLRARVLLLGSGRLSDWEEVLAYRVLAEVSPKAYLPKLVDGLLLASYRSRDPRVDLSLATEAVGAARRITDDVPGRVERLRRALDARQRALFALGRRAEGRAVCEELAGAGQGERLARALAEEGRFAEAAELCGKVARSGPAVPSFWDMTAWAAALEGAGRHGEALEVFGELVEETRRKAAGQESPLGGFAWELVHHSRMYDTAGRPKEAAAARQEALTVFSGLAAHGEPRSWSSGLSSWVTLFTLSGRADEPAATPEDPRPPFGSVVLHWAVDTRKAFFDELPALEERAARLGADGRLPELVDVRRRIAVRVVSRDGDRPYRLRERLGPFFDEGVDLARQLPGDSVRLARALTDRAMFSVALGSFVPAHADLAEAVAILGGP
ncbi:hypothetical protein [Streptomyces sp. NPDC048623]|uniref:hypothetical protein n=1 Tax=Streptomyces sp. NPDC048623 TaxID=3155761 RepID=UPI00343A37EA